MLCTSTDKCYCGPWILPKLYHLHLHSTEWTAWIDVFIVYTATNFELKPFYLSFTEGTSSIPAYRVLLLDWKSKMTLAIGSLIDDPWDGPGPNAPGILLLSSSFCLTFCSAHFLFFNLQQKQLPRPNVDLNKSNCPTPSYFLSFRKFIGTRKFIPENPVIHGFASEIQSEKN